jgi:hypothetical protein
MHQNPIEGEAILFTNLSKQSMNLIHMIVDKNS